MSGTILQGDFVEQTEVLTPEKKEEKKDDTEGDTTPAVPRLRGATTKIQDFPDRK